MEEYSVEECMLQLKPLLSPEFQLDGVTRILQKLTDLMKSPTSRNDLKSHHWDQITKLAESGSKILLKNSLSDEEYELVAFFLRFLRNSCADCLENRDHIVNNAAVFNFVQEALQYVMNQDTEKEELILQISVTLFGNILLCDQDPKHQIFNIFFQGNKFKRLLCSDNKRMRECTMFVLYSCISDETCRCLFNTEAGLSILADITALFHEDEVRWTEHVVDSLLEQDAFFDYYVDLPTKHRTVFLERLNERLKEESDKVFLAAMDKIKNLFYKFMISIKNSKLVGDDVKLLISILCRNSANEPYLSMLQKSEDFVQACVGNLIKIHLLSKGPEVRTDSNHFYQTYKLDLIRLVGNLSYRCKDNQDLVREMDCIPVILENTKPDQRYPFIREWSILAIRNLLENNLDNQAYVAGISTQGDVVDSDFLDSMGYQAIKEGGAIRIRLKE